MKKGKFNIVIGGQSGCEGKGKMAAYLARKFQPDVVCTAATPNCHHTAYINGEKKTSYHLPISALEAPDAFIVLGPSSVINLDTLLKEVEDLKISWRRILIHPRAVMVTDRFVDFERMLDVPLHGSTNKGVTVARMFKILREENLVLAEDVKQLSHSIGDTVDFLNGQLNMGRTVLCETSQGFDLCLEHGMDRLHCTSKMINPAMAMAEAGVSPKFIGDVYGVFQPYPIVLDDYGTYTESLELRWESLAARCEVSRPVDGTPKRIFDFAPKRFERFIMVCRPDYLCLQFANFITWKDYNVTTDSHLSLMTSRYINSIEDTFDVPIAYVGTGEEGMVDRGIDDETGFEKTNRAPIDVSVRWKEATRYDEEVNRD